MKAKMASLPEDCGGAPGYRRLLKILADEKNEEYEEMSS
ncbi:MAG: plasmid pRiA4b ORF-3 family protein [Clostridia bacterium]|nr:plasmid pRiA4b ORF-3 family protein [Clostridia bacterium]